MKNLLKATLVVVLLIALLFGVFQYLKQAEESSQDPPKESESLVMCTMEAKICPDGSGVGRIGPDCQFAPCP